MKEADLQRAVSDYLQYQMNLGKLYFDRLNSGSILTKRGKNTYRVSLCREGTADFMVVKGWETDRFSISDLISEIIFLELKGTKGKQRPEQKEFQELVEAQGAEYYVVRSIEELEDILEA